MNTIKYLTLVAAIASSFAASSARAAVLVTFYDTQPAATVGSYLNIGNSFTVGSNDLQLTRVAAFAGDQVSGGFLTDNIAVTLYDLTAQAQIGSAVVPIGTAVDANGFAWVPYSLTIAAATDLAFTAYNQSGHQTQYGMSYGSTPVVFATGPGLTWVNGISSANIETVPWNIATPPYNQLASSSFEYGVVPEPSTWALLAFAPAIILVIRRRRALAKA